MSNKVLFYNVIFITFYSFDFKIFIFITIWYTALKFYDKSKIRFKDLKNCKKFSITVTVVWYK